MANNAGRNGKAQKQYYLSYNYEKNRKIRLERHLSKHPEDAQAQAALKNIHFRPKAPLNRLGWIDRTATIGGFTSEKKNDTALLFSDHKGPKDAKDRAQMAAHVRKIERMIQHGHDFNVDGQAKSRSKKKSTTPKLKT
jgi:hypothetical protein